MDSLTRLTQLTFHLEFDVEFGNATVLPAQLQRLYLIDRGTSWGSVLQPVLKLQQLQQLEVTFQQQQQRSSDPPMHALVLQNALPRLALLPALQHVKVEYLATDAVPEAAQQLAAGTPVAWGQMPQLRNLRLQFQNYGPYPQLEQIVAGLAACTSLTMLALQHYKPVDGDAALAQAVPKLQQLRHLELLLCGIRSTECMAAIGQLTQLTELRLEGNREVTQQGLMQLTGLKQLQHLGVHCTRHVTKNMVGQLWAALHKNA
jgi:hypothetical protein